MILETDPAFLVPTELIWGHAGLRQMGTRFQDSAHLCLPAGEADFDPLLEPSSPSCLGRALRSFWIALSGSPPPSGLCTVSSFNEVPLRKPCPPPGTLPLTLLYLSPQPLPGDRYLWGFFYPLFPSCLQNGNSKEGRDFGSFDRCCVSSAENSA